jgi:hypothetical protein
VESRGVLVDASLEGQLERMRRHLGSQAVSTGDLDAGDAKLSHAQG